YPGIGGMKARKRRLASFLDQLDAAAEAGAAQVFDADSAPLRRLHRIDDDMTDGPLVRFHGVAGEQGRDPVRAPDFKRSRRLDLLEGRGDELPFLPVHVAVQR